MGDEASQTITRVNARGFILIDVRTVAAAAVLSTLKDCAPSRIEDIFGEKDGGVGGREVDGLALAEAVGQKRARTKNGIP